MPERTVFQSMSQRHVVSLGPTATVHEAACVMTHAGCGSVLIIDNASHMQGILTERDLMTRVVAKALACWRRSGLTAGRSCSTRSAAWQASGA